MRSNLVSVSIARHTEPLGCTLTFGSLNIHSLSPLKLDALLVEQRERSLDVMILCETWHDSDSVSIQRLRAGGFGVVECARPRTLRAEPSLAVNHGGVAIIAVPGIHITGIPVGSCASTYECVTARLVSRQLACVVVLINRTSPVTTKFFTEFTATLDRFLTYVDPVIVAGDVNLHLERPSHPSTVEFRNLLYSYGLVQHVVGTTHDAGGTFAIVCTRDDPLSLDIETADVGLSDQRLLQWSMPPSADVHVGHLSRLAFVQQRHFPHRPVIVGTL